MDFFGLIITTMLQPSLILLKRQPEFMQRRDEIMFKARKHSVQVIFCEGRCVTANLFFTFLESMSRKRLTLQAELPRTNQINLFQTVTPSKQSRVPN